MFEDDDDDDESIESDEEIETTSDEDDENEMEPLVSIDQWVKTIDSISVRSKFSGDAVMKNLGVEKLCRTDDQNRDMGWIFFNDNREETLVVSFEMPVFINEILIYESLNSGSVVQIEMFEAERQRFWTMWKRNGPEESSSSIFKPRLRRFRIRSKTIRLTFDPRHADCFGIKSIQLRGSNHFDTTFDQISVGQAMKNLFDAATNQIDTDVCFRFGEKLRHAHRNILSCRSSYFRALLTNDFLEKRQIEPIELTDINEETFNEILHFIYTGQFSLTISLDISLQSMFYADKIDLITAKNAAIEKICCILRCNHQEILSVYLIVKPFSNTFELLLDYIYELSTEHFPEISRQKQFHDLDKDSIIDLISQIAQRQEIREEKRKTEVVVPFADDSSSDES